MLQLASLERVGIGAAERRSAEASDKQSTGAAVCRRCQALDKLSNEVVEHRSSRAPKDRALDRLSPTEPVCVPAQNYQVTVKG